MLNNFITTLFTTDCPAVIAAIKLAVYILGSLALIGLITEKIENCVRKHKAEKEA